MGDKETPLILSAFWPIIFEFELRSVLAHFHQQQGVGDADGVVAEQVVLSCAGPSQGSAACNPPLALAHKSTLVGDGS